NGSRQRHSSPSSLASGSSTDETGPPHRIPDSPHVPSSSRRHHVEDSRSSGRLFLKLQSHRMEQRWN
ncbi:hypothetical protein CN106_36155, partial [Sinorhizobium meliloti]